MPPKKLSPQDNNLSEVQKYFIQGDMVNTSFLNE